MASAVGSGMERTATAWLALEAGGGALAVGIVLAARMMPSLLFGLAAGTLADRMDRRRQLVSVALGGVPLMVLLGWLTASGNVQVWQVVLVSFAAGCVQVFDIPARQTLIVDALSRELAPTGVALSSLVTRLSMAASAFAAGLLISAGGLTLCYLVVAVALGLAALLVNQVRVPRAVSTHAALLPFRRALADAARLIVDVPAVRTLIIAGIVCEVFAFSHPTAVPVVARDVLQSGAEGLGVLNASIALGGTLGVLMLSLLPIRIRREPVMGGVFVVYGASLIALAQAGTLPLAAAALLVAGACAASFDALQQTLIQLAVPEHQRGRAIGVWVLGIGSAPVGHLETGALVTWIGAPGALAINGSLVVVSAAALLVRAPIYRGSLGATARDPSGTYPPASH
jgi:predicted MFS family arabinose efflux permease